MTIVNGHNNRRRSSLSGEPSSRRDAQVSQDADVLATLGHTQELPRQFNLWSMLALAFTVLGTWSTLAQNLASGLTAGGPVSILWGLVLVTACNLCVAVSLGELTSAMPTALGQAYWIFRILPTPTGRFISYMCAWINTFGWWTLTASQTAFMTNFILAMKLLFSPDWAGAHHSWLSFLIYIGLTALLTVVNIVACRRDRVLPWINNVVGVQFTALFLAFALALLISVGVKAGMAYQSGSFVFGTWINNTSWPSGVVWFTGLIQSAYGLTAFDACIHMVEELPAPGRNGPRIIWLSVLIGAVSGFLFMMVCLFCVQSVEGLTGASLPFVELCLSTIGLTGAAVLLAFFIVNGVGQNVSIMTTASRLTWGFARDGGLPWHKQLAVVSDYWRVPTRALWAQGVLIGIVGVLYLFANTVLQAILSVSTIALTISYGIPIAVLLIQGRDKLPVQGEFRLGRWGLAANIVSLVYCVVTTVFFFFPSDPNPKPANMNWAIAVFGVMLVIALGFWFVQGRRSYLRTEEAMLRSLVSQAGQEDVLGTVCVEDADARGGDGESIKIRDETVEAQTTIDREDRKHI
ncbi:uncharacterized protein PV06_02177 [Exophiala oligosperma]|uniref:Choline transport protein n=2 Tax=Chaetothyriales TaxID=34395 RepID=A0A0D2DTR5_9EURO|nr:uncharacterized protein PV06_02177 [Exophiala oligosperma]KAJ9629105.1 hypothetical protein H2204_009045 [Knufia peltigerae]KIW46508.1 hypothetical protein PV06_02177 [Exophiala oligosperma]